MKREPRTKAAKLPEGFVELKTTLDGFFERKPGNSVHGMLLGSFEVRGKFGTKTVFRIEVTDGETLVGEGELIGPGGVIGLDSTGYTKKLADLEPRTIVFIRYEGKQGKEQKDPHIFTVARAEL